MLMRATSPFAYETAGAARTRHSLRLLVYGGASLWQELGRIRVAGMRTAVIARSEATKQSMSPRAVTWIASRSLSSGAHSRDPLARNDGDKPPPSFRGAKRSGANPESIQPRSLRPNGFRVRAARAPE